MAASPHWEAWTVAALGAWTVASPWAVGFSDQGAATLNAVATGGFLTLGPYLAWRDRGTRNAWICTYAGFWLMLAPAVLEFDSLVEATVSAVAAGLLTVLVATWSMSPLDQWIGRRWRRHSR
jgi:hypothetical protein